MTTSGPANGDPDPVAHPKGSLAARAAASAWVAGEPHLAEAIADLSGAVGEAQARLGQLAVELAQPGPVDPIRVARAPSGSRRHCLRR